MKKYLVLLALFVPLLVFGLNTPEITQAPNSSRLYRTSFYLVAGNQYKFRTFSSDDTVIYILNSSNVQVAYNDDCGSDCISGQTSLNSTITYTPSISGYYYGVMRHYSNEQVGKTATIKAYNNGTLIATQEDRPLGGYRIQVDSWTPSSWMVSIYKKVFRNIYFYYFNSSKEETGGSQGNDTVMYLISGNQIIAYDDDSGANWSSKIMRTSGSCSSGCYVLGGAYPSTDLSEGNARMIMDVHTTECIVDMNGNCYSNTIQPYYDYDYDRDGISNTLENIMGTSSTIVTGVDTDEDGLNDYIETFGTADILLPWEGSSPTLKDVFAEVDYFGRLINGNMFYFYKNFETDIETRLKYSFGYHGDIRLHIDVNDYLGVMETGGALEYAECGTGTAADTFYLANEKTSHFTSARAGIYTWIVAANKLKNDQTMGGRSCGGYGSGDPSFIISAGFNIDGGSLNRYTGTTIHEYGHIFMLGHNDNGNVDTPLDLLDFAPNSIIHRSVMNYRWQMGVPANVYVQNPFPPYNLISFDSPYRYSTDNSTNRTDLDWSYNNIVYGTGANGCIVDPWIDNGCTSDNDCSTGLTCDIVTGVCRSPKLACINLGAASTSTCDCTFEEWNLLDLTGAGIIGLGEGGDIIESDSESIENSPVFGRNGKIIASNIEDLRNSGEKFTKLTKESEKKEYSEKLKNKNEEFWTIERKEARLKNYLKKLEEKGLKEGVDYEIINGEVSFN